jgi:hypothetical protein
LEKQECVCSFGLIYFLYLLFQAAADANRLGKKKINQHPDKTVGFLWQ